jgi:hypothetical protein
MESKYETIKEFHRDKKQVLRNDIGYKEKVLLLTYTDIQGGVMIEDLYDWTEYSNFPEFKTRILIPLHESRLIGFDKSSHFVPLSPLRVQEVEERVLSKPLQPKAASRVLAERKRK